MAIMLEDRTSFVDAPVGDSGTSQARGDRAVVIGGAALVAAGVVHGAAIAAHSEHRSAVWAFLGVAAVQLVAGAVALARPSRRIGLVVGLIGVVTLAGWVVAKVSGLPGVGGLEEAEPVRFADALAAGLAGVAVLCGLKALVLSKVRVPNVVAVGAVAVLAVVAVPGVVKAVNHPHGETEVAAGVAKFVASAVPARPFDPKLPIDLGGVKGVSPQQQARAENLLADTVRGLPQWSDPAVAEANGYRSIRDGGTGDEHYVNFKFMENDTILDPDEAESLVYDTTVKPKRLVAAMYMLPPGPKLADAPDVGGALTQWHIHNNLCFTAEAKVAGLTDAEGKCPPLLFKGPEQPMLHVWIVPRPCGPFSALEGIGAGQIEEGKKVACDHLHGS